MAQRPGTATLQQRLPSFQHERLKSNANSIRLVQIHGSTVKSGPISLRITQYAKHRRPKYAAISYTWGSSAHLHPVQINGKPFFVHANLYNLLLHLRQRGESRLLWVDALCIDQQNLVERNFHVQLMAQIYDEATSTIVWLGAPSDDRREARAIDFVSEMAEYLRKTKREVAAGFERMYFNDIAAPRWSNLMAFCCRSNYWTRAWIVQEFLQARQIEMYCGTAQLDWSLYASVFGAIREHCRSSSGAQPDLEDILRRILSSIPGRLTARRLSGKSSPLQDLLHEFYDAECSEPRDKVYGMLGIASDCGDLADTGTYSGPQPDYSKHILEVYFDVLVHLRDTFVTQSVSPLTTYLLQQSLQIGKLDVLEYLSQFDEPTLQVKMLETSFKLQPMYMNAVSDTITSWTSVHDLQQRLDDFDWSQYVGYTVQARMRPQTPQRAPSSPTPSFSSQARTSVTGMHRVASLTSTVPSLNAIPKDLISNALAVAEVHPALSTLYHYLPQANGFHLPPSLLTTHHQDKQLLGPAASSQRPTLIIESSPCAQPVRLGFAPPGTRRGDIICQFQGTDLTLIARRPAYGGQSLQLVGRAIMVTHEGLSGKQGEVHPICRAGLGRWGSSCLGEQSETVLNGEQYSEVGSKDFGEAIGGGTKPDMSAGVDGEFAHEVIETDAISMFEILRGGELKGGSTVWLEA
ncbi:uncharacterized protein AB675_1879 [Cyphellophora attinorum]|uniref:Heterokaryon incompatibility domain-containing protein n=1 Tax=Cyphellophora attinorum TaxID=1664694 RepID=A0A0N1HDY5_9EURO|nr:uncharacterized protein AB675_1879 [Phialophora attinorum]KPI42833.1 hypothetical protein AB675_1879 [Phialophora attinorum]